MRLGQRSRRRSSRGHVRINQGPAWAPWAVWAVVAGVGIILAVFVIRQLVGPADDKPFRPDNRTWLEFAWSATPVEPDAIQQLGQRLASNQINMVYLEAAAWRSDGALVEGQYAAEFAQALRAAFPEIKVALWVRLSAEQIAQPEARAAVINLASKAIREWKFDGAQVNGRAVLNGSEDFAQLLRDFRAAVGTTGWLSVTVPPDRIPTDPGVPMGPTIDPDLTWDVNYKQRIGLLQVDEIVIMAHASGLQSAEDYKNWVAYQVASYTTALAQLEQPVAIFAAVPTYEAAPEHDPAVESVTACLNGVRDGIKRAGKQARWVKGVGLYEYKTTDSLEWTLYRKHWLGLQAD